MIVVHAANVITQKRSDAFEGSAVEGSVIETIKLSMRRFGRLASLDFRDHDHLLKHSRRLLSSQKVPKFRHWNTPRKPLDQKQTSECTAYCRTHWLLASPVRNKPDTSAEALNRFYHECQKRDEWEGEDYDGTSVRAVCKYSQEIGEIGEYQWMFDVPTIDLQVRANSPVMVGTIWTEQMNRTDSKGWIRARGRVEGGHAYLISGSNPNKRVPHGGKGAFRILNSWGDEWGENGEAWISFDDFAALMREDGEAVAAREILIK